MGLSFQFGRQSIDSKSVPQFYEEVDVVWHYGGAKKLRILLRDH